MAILQEVWTIDQVNSGESREIMQNLCSFDFTKKVRVCAKNREREFCEFPQCGFCPDVSWINSRQNILNSHFLLCKQSVSFTQFCFELMLISTLKLEVAARFVF